mgnify:CR=1 FL=1
MTNGSTVLAEDPGVDLAIAEAMVAELEEYIIKEELYRTLIVRTSAGDQNVRMTGGDLLARLHRLQGETDRLRRRSVRPIRLSTVCARAFTSGYNAR